MKSISPKEAQEILAKEPDAILLDVRTADEYADVHAKGAKLIPLDRLTEEAVLDLCEGNKQRKILAICQRGSRSQSAVNIMSSMGFGSLYNVTGGTMAWKAAGLDVEEIKSEATAKRGTGLIVTLILVLGLGLGYFWDWGAFWGAVFVAYFFWMIRCQTCPWQALFGKLFGRGESESCHCKTETEKNIE